MYRVLEFASLFRAVLYRAVVYASCLSQGKVNATNSDQRYIELPVDAMRCSSVNAPSPDRNPYRDDTTLPRRTGLREKSLRDMPVRKPFPMKPQYATSAICSVTCNRISRFHIPAVVVQIIHVEAQKIKRSRGNFVTRPIEARGSTSVS